MSSLRKKALILAAALVIPACGGKVVVDGFGAAQGASGSGGSGGTSSTSSIATTGGVTTGEGSGGSGGSPILDAGPDTYFPPPVAAIYANSSSELYVVNPATNAVSAVGPFQGCDFIIDLAVNRTGDIFAASNTALYAIDPKTAKCTPIAAGAYPNSLSFVPQGILDPDHETLVGYNGATYERIDTSSGVVTPIGDLGDPNLFSSGDMFSLIGGGTYLTVKGGTCSDCLVEVDPASGKMLKMLGSIGLYADIWGLAYWGGTTYGFTAGGLMFALDLATMATTPINYPGDAVPFWGAGSSTAAPM
jgi:hypothetical protein